MIEVGAGSGSMEGKDTSTLKKQLNQAIEHKNTIIPRLAYTAFFMQPRWG